MIRKSSACHLCLLLAAIAQFAGCGGPELPRPDEQLRFKFANEARFVSGDSTQLVVGLEAADEAGNARDVPCDHGKTLADRRVIAQVHFFDVRGNEIDYRNIELHQH
jgi:hypothetical protein